ncbi:hypothetical protein HS088_TW08G00428 [Tripterygium wilfordii]|uniref:Uncharacterized protein n=1 Tax=Tripterygium wilfordii TaxID=458696 RepID=A0A7J7DBW6_TRIWF|nr:hypothetical protein HS088_TW08G00428 [Tripterygium wilfordii]
MVVDLLVCRIPKRQSRTDRIVFKLLGKEPNHFPLVLRAQIEDHGFGSSFFPFIVAEEDVCTEIRMLESAIEFTETDADIELKDSLNILLDGTVGAGEDPTPISAMSEMGLLHRAVRRNSRSLVVLLLRYILEKVSDESGSEHMVLVGGSPHSYLLIPDVSGPAGLTPLHVAAGKDGSEIALDALIDDPGMVGIEAWKSAYDSTGFTPEDYARLRGHYSYIHLVQRKINKRPPARHVVVDIPGSISDCKNNQKQNVVSAASFEIGQTGLRPVGQHGKLCDSKRAYGIASRSLVYRPAMLLMVAVAAVCVCVALLIQKLLAFGRFLLFICMSF